MNVIHSPAYSTNIHTPIARECWLYSVQYTVYMVYNAQYTVCTWCVYTVYTSRDPYVYIPEYGVTLPATSLLCRGKICSARMPPLRYELWWVASTLSTPFLPVTPPFTSCVYPYPSLPTPLVPLLLPSE